MSKDNHWGSTLEDFLNEEGIHDEAKANAASRVIAWQLAEEMARNGVTRTEMAERMRTSRAQINRILKAEGNVTIGTLQRAAALLGKHVRIELV